MKEYVAETGGRKLYNEDFNSFTEFIKSYEQFYADEDPFVISGVELTNISGDIYNISSGYVWIDGRVRKFAAQTNVDLSSNAYINASDISENKLYNDNISRVSAINYSTVFSASFISTSQSLLISPSSTRRYVENVLGGHALLKNPVANQQTVAKNVVFSGQVNTNGSLIANTITVSSGGITVSGGGLTVTSGNTIIRNVTVSAGGLTISAGNLNVTGDGIFSGNLTAANIVGDTLTINGQEVVNSSGLVPWSRLTGYVTITAGSGLTGGGVLSANRSISIASGGVVASMLAVNSVSSNAIQSNAITSSKIASDAVTGSKIASETITADNIADGTITGTQIASGSINGDRIASNTITATQLGSGSVGSSELQSNSVTADKINNGAVTGSKIANNTITASNIASNAVGASELANDSVDTAAIIDAAVTTVKIDDGAITNAKIAASTITGNRLASKTITAGNIADNTITSLQLATNSVGSSELADNAVDASAIQSNAVTTSKIADGAVTASKLASNSVTNVKIASGAVDTDELAADAVTSSKIAAGAVDNTSLATNAVSSVKISSSAVTTSKIADNAVTAAKIASGSVPPSKISAGSYAAINVSNFSGSSLFVSNSNLTAKNDSDPITLYEIVMDGSARRYRISFASASTCIGKISHPNAYPGMTLLIESANGISFGFKGSDVSGAPGVSGFGINLVGDFDYNSYVSDFFYINTSAAGIYALEFFNGAAQGNDGYNFLFVYDGSDWILMNVIERATPAG